MDEFVCIFCNHSTNHITKLISHLISHLNYNPFKCTHCFKAFPSMFEFAQHGQYHMQKKELEFEYDRKLVFDDWLTQITNFLTNDQHLKVDPKEECVVCSKYKDYFESIHYKCSLFTIEDCKIDMMNDYKTTQNVLDPRTLQLRKLSENQIFLLYHIHYHLQYFPYQCSVKLKDQKKECGARFSFIGKEFYDHLNKLHNISFNFVNNNADCYDKSFYIEQLDRIVEKFYREKKDDRNDLKFRK